MPPTSTRLHRHRVLIAELFPKPAATGRPPREPRESLDAIFWIVRTGAPWRDVPEDFGPWKTVYNHFDRWNADGTLDQVRKRLLSRFVDQDQIDKELWCINGTIVRAARCATGGGKKTERTRGSCSCAIPRRFFGKNHLACDANELPFHFEVTPGQGHEKSSLIDLLKGTDGQVTGSDGQAIAWPTGIAVDKGYRAEWIDEILTEMGITTVIPSKENEDRSARLVNFNKEKYRQRNVVKRLIGWLK